MIEQPFICPFCSTSVSILVDLSVPHQEYIEDCENCCRPIEFSISTDGVEIIGFEYSPLEQ